MTFWVADWQENTPLNVARGVNGRLKISGCNSDGARSCHQERLWKRNVKNPRKATGLGISTLPQMRTWCSQLTITLANYICVQIWLIIDIWGLVQLGHGYTWHVHRLFSSYIIKIENNYRSWWVYQQSTLCNSRLSNLCQSPCTWWGESITVAFSK